MCIKNKGLRHHMLFANEQSVEKIYIIEHDVRDMLVGERGPYRGHFRTPAVRQIVYVIHVRVI